MIWIERKAGAVWAVGRAVNLQHRPSAEPRQDDYLFEGYELEDALEAANGALEDDVRVLEDDGALAKVRPFTRKEVLPMLERFFFGATADGLFRPLQVRVRNRVAVRVVGGEAERAVDPRLELLREGVLEPDRLVVHVVDADPERLGEVELEQPVVSDHLERHLLAGVRERDAAVGRVLGEPERRELLHHRARRRRRDLLAAGERGRRDTLALDAELVDLLQVVLDRVAEIRLRHGTSVGREGRWLASADADSPRPQPRSRRRVHVLGDRGRRDRHARLRVRAGPAGHPDPERVGARRPARGDRDLAARVSVRPGPLRAAAARREHRLRLRADPRRARAAQLRAAARSRRSSSRDG